MFLKNIKYTMIFYESVHHLKDTLNLIYSVFGNRKIAICRELTKVYEECVRDDLENIISNFDNIILKGEFVIVVEGNKTEIDYSDLDLVEHVGMYISDGLDKMEAIKQTSKDLKLSKSEVYKKYQILSLNSINEFDTAILYSKLKYISDFIFRQVQGKKLIK